MDKERTKIDQKLCDTVRMMMAGKDAKVSQVVELLGISQATVNRIRQAGYSLEQFNKDKNSRNERKKELKEQQQAEEQRPGAGMDDQVPGQICMDLQPAMDDRVLIMRFFAGQFAKVTEKIDRLNDTMNQILRRMDK